MPPGLFVCFNSSWPEVVRSSSFSFKRAFVYFCSVACQQLCSLSRPVRGKIKTMRYLQSGAFPALGTLTRPLVLDPCCYSLLLSLMWFHWSVIQGSQKSCILIFYGIKIQKMHLPNFNACHYARLSLKKSLHLV